MTAGRTFVFVIGIAVCPALIAHSGSCEARKALDPKRINDLELYRESVLIGWFPPRGATVGKWVQHRPKQSALC
jgi:hypothetical protein